MSVNTRGDVLRAFVDADWSFSGRARTEEFHPYPARFIPEIPRLVVSLTNPGGFVLDPFCGSGTTLFEARRAGLHAIGSDINPIACLISRVRTTPVGREELDIVVELAAQVREAASRATSVDQSFNAIPRIDHWFTLAAQRAMAGASHLVAAARANPAIADILSVGISAATVRISNQDSDTRYAAIEKRRTQQECAAILEQSILKVARWVGKYSGELAPSATASVYQRDAQDLSWIADNSVGLACFSPPYPNAYEYWLYHKYRMYWLGFDPIAVRGQEIGARAHYSKPNGLDESDFLAQMTRVYRELFRVLRPDALAVAVVGDSFIGGRKVDNGELLLRAGEASGFAVLGSVARPVAENRSSFNRSHSRGRKSEHIVIVRKSL